MKIDREQADALLTTTRAVRRRLDFDRPVEPHVIQDCVRIALQAPIGSRAWKQHFIVVMDSEKRRRIADAYRRASYPRLDERKQMALALDDEDPELAELMRGNLALARWLADTLHQVPCLVIVAKEGRVERNEAFAMASFYGSILPAAWSFMLALRARGLGACWTCMHIVNEKDVAEVLDIPPDVTQAVMFTVGYYKGSTFRPAPRRAAREQIHWDGWGVHAGTHAPPPQG